MSEASFASVDNKAKKGGAIIVIPHGTSGEKTVDYFEGNYISWFT